MPTSTHNTLRFTLPPATSPWANPLMGIVEQPERSDLRTPGSTHSDAVRMMALAAFAETGSPKLAAESVGLPRTTVQKWVNDEDSLGLVDDLRSTIRLNYGWEIAQMVGEGLSRIRAAWARGNPHVDKSGRVTYVPASAKDETITTSILMDKWMLISGAISQSAALVAGMDKLSRQVTELGAGLLAQGEPQPPPESQDRGGETLVW